MSAAADNRERILAEARRLLAEQGYAGLSMREIAEAAGVSKAAIYYHFADKEALFAVIVSQSLGNLEAMIDEARAQAADARAAVGAIVQGILTQPEDERAIIRLVTQEIGHISAAGRARFDEAYYRRFIGKIRGALQAGMDSGEFRPVDPTVATWSLLGMMHPFFYPARSRRAVVPPSAAEQLLTIFLDGIAR